MRYHDYFHLMSVLACFPLKYVTCIKPFVTDVSESSWWISENQKIVTEFGTSDRMNQIIFFKTRTAILYRGSTWEIQRLPVLGHIICKYSVRISKPCMDGSLCGIFAFLREVTTYMLYIPITFCVKQIQEICFEIRFVNSVFYSFISLNNFLHYETNG